MGFSIRLKRQKGTVAVMPVKKISHRALQCFKKGPDWLRPTTGCGLFARLKLSKGVCFLDQLYRDKYRAEKYGYDCTTQDNVLRVTTGPFMVGEVLYNLNPKGEYVFVKENGYRIVLTRNAFFQRLIRLARG